MERRFGRDTRLQELYADFMQQYEDLGHMAATARTNQEDDQSCFLPHHGVLREGSSTTKLRVVFNDFATTATGDNLNRHFWSARISCLHWGTCFSAGDGISMSWPRT